MGKSNNTDAKKNGVNGGSANPPSPQAQNSNEKEDNSNKQGTVERKSFSDWASDERLPSWKIASIITERKITADKILTKNEFISICKGRG